MTGMSVCPGHRMRDGGLLGLCLICARTSVPAGPTPKAIAPAAEQGASLTWRCPNFTQVAA